MNLIIAPVVTELVFVFAPGEYSPAAYVQSEPDTSHAAFSDISCLGGAPRFVEMKLC